MASWSTKKLLRELDRRNILYAPSASRSDLEDAFVRSNTSSSDFVQGDDDLFATPSMDFGPNEHNRNYDAGVAETASTMPLDQSTHFEWEERLQKRSQRRQRNMGDSLRFSSTRFSQYRLVKRIPRIAGTIVDGVVRRARRLKREFADFWALDDESGVRDVRYEYLRRETISPQTSSVEVIPMDPDDFIVSDPSYFVGGSSFDTSIRHPPHSTSSFDESVPRRNRSSGRFLPKLYSKIDDERLPSHRGVHKDGPRLRLNNEASFLLPPGSGFDESHSSDDFSSYARKGHRRRTKDMFPAPKGKKVYNPYGESSVDDEKDVVDRVSDFLADTAERVMWGMFDEPFDVELSQDHSSCSKKQDAFQELEPSQRRGRHSRKPPRHWKDRMEERLDSMLGLHQDGDFYRSWTERIEQEKSKGHATKHSSYSPSRQRKKQPSPIHSKPFWEEEGNIFSLLFGRSDVDPGRRFDRRLGFETGSMLSIFRVLMHSFLVVASYLCRWASTQGAIPQPVVVLGVSSAVLCARPHRRLLVAGFALLLLRTVGEVLHGYVYGSDGWENDGEFDNVDLSSENENASDGTMWDG